MTLDQEDIDAIAAAVRADLTPIANSLASVAEAIDGIRGAGFDAGTNSLAVIHSTIASQVRTNLATELGMLDAPVSGIPSPTGSGDTAVTSATLDDNGDSMVVQTADEEGIDEVTVRAYVKSEYEADTLNAVVRAQTTTVDNGSWPAIYLDEGVTYTIVFTKSGYTFQNAEVTP